jgi:hypothetical protein
MIFVVVAAIVQLLPRQPIRPYRQQNQVVTSGALLIIPLMMEGFVEPLLRVRIVALVSIAGSKGVIRRIRLNAG